MLARHCARVDYIDWHLVGRYFDTAQRHPSATHYLSKCHLRNRVTTKCRIYIHSDTWHSMGHAGRAVTASLCALSP